jgi:hypothetical protein
MGGLLFLLLGFVLAATARGEIIDRVAVTVDNLVITESDIVREIRLAAFLDRIKPDFSGGVKRKTAERLIERALMDREMQLSRYPLPSDKEVDPLHARLRAGRFADEAAYRQALAQGGIQEADLRAFLLAQLTVLRFIEFRFKPSVQASETEIQQDYQSRFLPQSRARGVSPDPPLEAVRSEIEKLLVEEKTDRVLDSWMKDTRSRTRIVLQEKVFQ